MTIAQLQQEFLSSGNQKIAPEDFFILLAHATRKKKAFLLAHPEYTVEPTNEASVRDLLERRLEHEPIAYITGHKEFYGYDFKVTKDTLIPRPETELLVELTLNRISAQKENSIILVDVGTGSGNIIISIAKETEKMYQVSGIRYYAVDISKTALLIAKKNAKTHNVDQTITFLHGDLLKPMDKKIFSDHEIIITANLPYLSEAIYQAADDDVKKFEPESALVSNQEGLDHYYRLLEEIKNLRTQAQLFTLFLEVSPEQPPLLKSFILGIFPHAKVQIHKDLAGKERVVEVSI